MRFNLKEDLFLRLSPVNVVKLKKHLKPIFVFNRPLFRMQLFVRTKSGTIHKDPFVIKRFQMPSSYYESNL